MRSTALAAVLRGASTVPAGTKTSAAVLSQEQAEKAATRCAVPAPSCLAYLPPRRLVRCDFSAASGGARQVRGGAPARTHARVCCSWSRQLRLIAIVASSEVALATAIWGRELAPHVVGEVVQQALNSLAQQVRGATVPGQESLCSRRERRRPA